MKLGILGTGMIVKDLLTTINKLDIEYLAILGTDATKKETLALADKYDINQCYFSYEDMLDSDIDTIYVALPNYLHFSFAKKAILNNKHVIMEKPITANYQELSILVDLSREKKCFLLEAMNIHYMPVYQELKKDLSHLGRLKVVSMNYSQYSSRYDDFVNGTILPAFDYHKAGGALMDINVYNLHFIIGLFGRPLAVHYYANIENGIDTSGIMILEYPGFKAVCVGAKDCKASAVSTIQGDKGNIALHLPVNQVQSYEICSNKGVWEERAFDEGEHRLYYEFIEFMRIIEEGDVSKAEQMMEISCIVSEIMETGRKQEGIVFENDKNI